MKGSVFLRFGAFSKGRELIEDTVEDFHLQLMKMSTEPGIRLTARIIVEELILTQITVHQILTYELGLRKICAQMVTQLFASPGGHWVPWNFEID